MTARLPTARIRRCLAAALADVEVRLARAPLPESDVRRGDPADQVLVHAEREGIVADFARLQTRRQRLRIAMARLAQGTYGRGTECGQPIGPGRLAAVPETECCVTCQDRRERAAAEANETSHPSRRTP